MTAAPGRSILSYRMIRNVVFDFGNVLAHVTRERIGEAFASHSPLSPEEILRRIFGTDLERKAETGVWNSFEFFRGVQEAISGDPFWEYEEFVQGYCSALEPSQEGVEALRLASREGRRVFVLSNTSYLHARWLFEQESLATIPEWHVFSFKVGLMKPDPGIWHYLCSHAGIEPESTLYIDDLYENCAVAGELGFSTLNNEPGRSDLVGEIETLLQG